MKKKFIILSVAALISFGSGVSSAQSLGEIASAAVSILGGSKANANTQIGIVGAGGNLSNTAAAEGADSVAVTGMNAMVAGKSGGAAVNANTQIGYIGDKAIVTNNATAKNGGTAAAGVNSIVNR